MEPRARLEEALGLPDETEAKLAVVALIDELVQSLGFRAIVIGGLAVELWTHGGYTTTDIDLYLPHGPGVDELLAQLGFEKRGRHWAVEEAGLFVEAPASFPKPEEEVTEIELSTGAHVLVLSPEDVLVYRLKEFVATGHASVAEQTVALLASPELDRPRLMRRGEEERLLSGLSALEKLAHRLERGETVQMFELHDLARELRSTLEP